MKIIKYEKKKNGKYRLYLDNNETIDLYEDTILKNNLLYKKEIDEELLSNLSLDNGEYTILNKCINYIGVRLRSRKEIIDYIKKYTTDEIVIDNIINKLESNRLIDDLSFTKAFIKDKWRFTTLGPYRIINELKNHNINESIILDEINNITDEEILDKLDKQFIKAIKRNKNKPNLRNKLYNSFISQGYSTDHIVNMLNKYSL